MSSRVLIEPVSFSQDARGWVIEPVVSEAIASQRNLHVAWTEPGCVRGNHYHERGTEILLVMGPALVRLRESGAISDTMVPPGQSFRFTIPPGIAHAIQPTGDRPCLLMAVNSERHDPAHPDVVRDVLIEPRPTSA